MPVAFSLDCGTTFNTNSACHTGSEEQVGIRGIDDRIDLLGGDVTLNDLNSIFNFQFFISVAQASPPVNVNSQVVQASLL